MGLWSWLFPTDADRLARARALMAKGRWEDARAKLLHCKAPEAEALYDECSKHVDKADEATLKKRLASEGFHGWKVQISLSNPKRKAEFEAIAAEEIARAGIDLGLPDIDQNAVNTAVARAQRRFRNKAGKGAGRDVGMVKLVPIMDRNRSAG